MTYEEAIKKMGDAIDPTLDSGDGYVLAELAAEAIGLKGILERLEGLQAEIDLIDSERS